MEILWASLLHFCNFCISLAPVTTKGLLQKAKKKPTWCQNPKQPVRCQTACRNLDGSVFYIHHTALTRHQVSFTFLALWRSIFFVTDSIEKVQEYVSQWFFSQSPEFYRDYCQTLWNMTFGVLFYFLIINVILNKSFSISKYSLCILVSDLPT